MPKKTTDYPKPKLIAYLRQLADSGKRWEDMQKDILPGITCIGDVPPPHPEAPNIERRPRMGTDMPKTEIRHCLRDICKCVALLPTCCNKAMDEGWLERDRAERELTEFYNPSTRTGKYFDLARDIQLLKQASVRVEKTGVLDEERRRLGLICDDVCNRYRVVEEARFFLDQTRKRWPGSFRDVADWSPPVERDPHDHRKMLEIALDEIDFDAVPFDDGTVYYLEYISGQLVGHSQRGPLFFASHERAKQYIASKEMMSISKGVLSADDVQVVLRWYVDRHRFTLDEPTGGSFLFDKYPELTAARPADDSDLSEALETAGTRDTEW